MGEGASRGTGLLELDDESRNDGKPTLLLAIVNVCFGPMVSSYGEPIMVVLYSDIERSSGIRYSGPIILLQPCHCGFDQAGKLKTLYVTVTRKTLLNAVLALVNIDVAGRQKNN